MTSDLIHIGGNSILSDLPQKITIKNRPYILTKNQNGNLILYSAICPHAQGIVEPTGKKQWRCPYHGWTFDPETGNSIVPPNSHLSSYDVIEKNDKLFADLKFVNNNIISTNLPYHKNNLKSKFPKITLITQACLLVEWDGFNLLMDPWIEGLALCGSWTHFPPSQFTVQNLPKIDAIWISHEHSDHLHPYTLSLLDKNIPVYVPDFDNERLGKIVKKIGFKNVISMPPFQSFNLTKSIELISFKASMNFSDNILYLRTGEFTMLNFNDSGINWNIKDKVDHVDLVCAQFSRLPATTYPSNWTHLNEETKKQIIKEKNLASLKQLKLLVDVFKPDFFLPMASFVALFPPELLPFQKIKKGISLNDVKEQFKSSDVKVLDLIPGESWDENKNFISRVDSREKFFDDDYLLSYLKKINNDETMTQFLLTNDNLTHNQLKKYFLNFKNFDIVRFIGNMDFCLTTFSEKNSLYSLISFRDGDIIYQELSKPEKCELSMSIPMPVVAEIINNDLSWDEAFYWTTFHRDPDEYNLAFWKFMHAPWRSFNNAEWIQSNDPNMLGNVSIATLVEQGGKSVSDILEKYGLFCIGCSKSIGENLNDGCAIHGIPNNKRLKLIDEIKSKIKSLQ
ncbi:hypothetical protein NKOR_00480 [Candidatus Nitrosopumilus koreensis AR1]|uniref:Cytidine monophosphate-N-acetylneuraminic acid hydroxylase n=1 Tax=Candidatus Nitrosopumilus koreensis AR1 TaxID=1229908 RepID=K0B1Y2_9ARCH|nr:MULTISPECIES: Rieske 2Fe-2S domain-containing protein [Nitrosopumilus]AFS80018.1 hypothetical protein NKOR_00480 [Candidatus Nitrosopumilus koreensis AR1]